MITQNKRPEFKKISKRHQPKGLTVLYDDRDIIVVNKDNGLLTVSTDKEKEKTAFYLLNSYVKKGNSRSKNRVFIVHRLDRDTSGVLIFAKNAKVKRYLQDEWKEFTKTYFAIVHGKLQDKEGVISSYLLENKAYRVYSQDNPKKGRFSETAYRVVRESSKYSLLEINLLTGRKNQIRVHLADKGHPVAGDKIYGQKDKGIKRLCLHAACLTITHPFSNEKMIFETKPPPYFKTLVNF